MQKNGYVIYKIIIVTKSVQIFCQLEGKPYNMGLMLLWIQPPQIWSLGKCLIPNITKFMHARYDMDGLPSHFLWEISVLLGKAWSKKFHLIISTQNSSQIDVHEFEKHGFKVNQIYYYNHYFTYGQK